MTADSIGTLLAFLLTIAILSYLIGDNPLYRLAIHLFVGATAGYAAVIAYFNVIRPQLFAPLLAFRLLDPVLLGGLTLSVLLLLKLSPSASRWGSLATAFMVGVGTAVAIGGAVTGTLFPQTGATFLSLLPRSASGGFDLEKAVEALVIVAGTLTTLGFFYYGGRGEPGAPGERPALARPVALLGQMFIGTAFGVMYAGALAASLAMLADRVSALQSFIQTFMSAR